MDTKKVLVTPEKAIDWLEGNTHNRKLRDERVRQYARDIKRGEWHLTHQGIAFDLDGKLVDGQHRLWAIIEANMAVEMLVSTDVSKDTQLVIDDHLPRTGVDALHLQGKGSSRRKVAIVNILIRGFKRGRATHVELLEAYERYEDSIEWTTEQFLKSTRLFTVSCLQAAVARAFYSADLNDLASFCKLLTTGMPYSHMTENQVRSVSLLRNYIMTQSRVLRQGRVREDIYRRATRALFAYLNDEDIRKLYGSKSELFPLKNETLSEREKELAIGKMNSTKWRSESRKAQHIKKQYRPD